jgi:hypothetical protein
MEGVRERKSEGRGERRRGGIVNLKNVKATDLSNSGRLFVVFTIA